ncbi:fatty acyl-CoA reductase wat-like isoform X1 [Leptopilina heterotoma]|uniref:fatty acyl-CoA reductase wat-like isoform X1 n=3 Tax=Leptopilina heterotoma TaxID=63436 RepID=UPI001CA8E580|nr:fatty acyl-CoA reductase wat-like isoform X1 [Leptopilina heterotoma]
MSVERTSEDYIEEMIRMIKDNEIVSEKSDVTEFYSNCNIFITGGSGFIGKLLLEKVLRCFPNMGKLYMMLRPKKGKSPEERFKEHFDDPLYERLKQEQPDYASKIFIIEGDTEKFDLGLSPNDRELIIKNTHIIFHAAATVRFDEKLRQAVNINVRGLQLMLQLAKEMKNLKAFVHISTAFAHCISKDIDEKFYPPPMDVNKLLSLLDLLDDEQLEYLTPLLLGKWPNSYAFSKAMAEEAVRRYSPGIPICVVRPSIVVSTWKEPIAGWTNNLYGATGVVVGSGIGLLRTLHCVPNNVAEIIPADIVINNIVVAAWDIAQQWNEKLIIEEEPPVFNCISSNLKPITWGRFMALNQSFGFELPSKNTIWYNVMILNENFWLHTFCMIFLHLVPAAIVDCILYLMGKKPMLLKAYKKIHKFMGVIAYFSSQEWNFHSDSNQALFKKLNSLDRQKFDFDLNDLDWENYMHYHVRGLRLFVLKDTMDTIEEGKIHYRRLRIAHYAVVTAVFCLLVWLMFSLLRYLFFMVF